MYTKNEKYVFLNEKLSKEAHVEEILSEIELRQANWSKSSSNELATIENLNESRNIKIPITPRRSMNIQYFVDMLVKHHPAEVKPVFSFKFAINQANKNIKIEEKVEYTFMLKEAQFNQLQTERNRESTETLNELIKNFRLFNLTKLFAKTQNRAHLSHLVKTQLGTNIFTLKYYSIDNSGLINDEDYCFHRDNYEAVKLKLDFEDLKRIIAINITTVNRHLKNYGILNANVNDYRDNKLDYILNILSNYLTESFHKSDEIKIKNFKNLRECLIKVDKLLDPVSRLDSEILNYLHEKFMATDRDIISIFPDMTHDALNQWASKKVSSEELIIHNNSDNKYFIDPRQFINKYELLTNSIINGTELTNADMTIFDNNIFTADLLTDAGTKLLEKNPNVQKLLDGADNIEKLKHLMGKYTHHKKKANTKPDTDDSPKKTGLFSSLKQLIHRITQFFSRRKQKQQSLNLAIKSAKMRNLKRGLSEATKDILREIVLRDAPIIPISDFIELKPENDDAVEKIIDELRDYNLKIVIPIYKARQNLYVKRSKNYIISDVEYLLVDPEYANSSESIYDYVDSITGFQLKEDVITGNALMAIEKYLFTEYRKNKAKLKRKK